MNRFIERVRPVASTLSPRARRYRAYLRSLPLNTETLPEKLEAPNPGSFVLCGCPRTGTTSLSAALFQPPVCVSVMDPWDGMRLEPAPLVRSLRRFINGLPTAPFLVCLRNPAEVAASLRDAGGRVQQGLQYDTIFNRQLNTILWAATDDDAVRRILLFDHVHEQLAPLLERDNVLVVRYERWASEREALLDEISAFLGRDLSDAPVRVRPAQPLRMEAHEIALLRAHCRTAGPIGYDLP